MIWVKITSGRMVDHSWSDSFQSAFETIQQFFGIKTIEEIKREGYFEGGVFHVRVGDRRIEIKQEL